MKQDPRQCSGAAALAVIGERYAPHIVREVSFGVTRFDGIARNTGAPRDVLAARLRTLVAYGVLQRVLYNQHPPRYEYHLTPAGQDLAPILLAVMYWGDRWLDATPCVDIDHHCGAALELVPTCRECGEQISLQDLTLHFKRPGWSRFGPTPGEIQAEGETAS